MIDELENDFGGNSLGLINMNPHINLNEMMKSMKILTQESRCSG
jgi:hypothetical protein